VKGYYQSVPFVFSCDGSGGDVQSNKVKVQLQGLSSGYQEIFRIPAGTSDFVLSVDGDSSADVEVIDPKGRENVVPHKMQNVGGNEFLGSYKHMDIRYVGHSSLFPTREKLSFSGDATPELSVRLKSHATSAKEFTLGFYYFPYSAGPQCEQGSAPVGCKTFHQAATRAAVVDWVKWLRTRYSDVENGWAGFLNTLSAGGAAPLTALLLEHLGTRVSSHLPLRGSICSSPR